MKEKTHWLQNPNKNYLGHFDLPNGEDVILTIDKAQWESVKNPKTNCTSDKRIVRFKEKNDWIKPLICNETNAKMIFRMTETSFMEDCEGKKIKIGIDKTKIMNDEVDCLRVRQIKSSALEILNKISQEQANELNNIANQVGFDISIVCNAYKIKNIFDLDLKFFSQVKDGLIKKNKAEVKNENL